MVTDDPGKQGGKKRKASSFASDDTSPEKASAAFGKVWTSALVPCLTTESLSERLKNACWSEHKAHLKLRTPC